MRAPLASARPWNDFSDRKVGHFELKRTRSLFQKPLLSICSNSQNMIEDDRNCSLIVEGIFFHKSKYNCKALTACFHENITTSFLGPCIRLAKKFGRNIHPARGGNQKYEMFLLEKYLTSTNHTEGVKIHCIPLKTGKPIVPEKFSPLHLKKGIQVLRSKELKVWWSISTNSRLNCKIASRNFPPVMQWREKLQSWNQYCFTY